MKKGDQPAYPVTEETTDRIDAGIAIYTGLTKREYFAAMAMQGLLSNPSIIHIHQKGAIDWIAEHSILQADALLNQLEKEEK